MVIDWFTVCAQALNFLILVWLMKRYLYKPILNAIDTREKLVDKQLADADSKQSEANKERDEFKQKNDDFDKNRDALLSKSTSDANTEKSRLLDEANKAADELSTKRQEAFLSDARRLNHSVSVRAQQEVFAVARKALQDLASAGLEEQMSDVFVRRLKQLHGKAKDSLTDALKSSAGTALVRSTFELPQAQQKAIKDALQETFSSNAEVKFEISPELVGGIEVVASGQKVAWTIADYLESLEKEVNELLNLPPKPAAKAKPKPGTKHKAKAAPKKEKAATAARN